MTSLLNWQAINNIATYLTNQVNNQSTVLLTDVVQLTLTLKMTNAQVVETSVTVNNNSPIQDYVHPDDHTQPIYESTPGFKPFTLYQTVILSFWHVTCVYWIADTFGPNIDFI